MWGGQICVFFVRFCVCYWFWLGNLCYRTVLDRAWKQRKFCVFFFSEVMALINWFDARQHVLAITKGCFSLLLHLQNRLSIQAIIHMWKPILLCSIRSIQDPLWIFMMSSNGSHSWCYPCSYYQIGWIHFYGGSVAKFLIPYQRFLWVFFLSFLITFYKYNLG